MLPASFAYVLSDDIISSMFFSCRFFVLKVLSQASEKPAFHKSIKEQFYGPDVKHNINLCRMVQSKNQNMFFVRRIIKLVLTIVVCDCSPSTFDAMYQIVIPAQVLLNWCCYF
jgi:hypothetical protein